MPFPSVGTGWPVSRRVVDSSVSSSAGTTPNPPHLNRRFGTNLGKSVSRETHRRTMVKLPAIPIIRGWCFLSGPNVREGLCCEIFESALFCSDIPFHWYLKSTEPLCRNTIRSDSVVTIWPLEQPGRWGDSRPSRLGRDQSSTAALFHVKRSQSATGTRGDSTDASSPPRWSTGTPCLVLNRRRARIHLMITTFYLQSLTRAPQPRNLEVCD